VPVKTAVSRYSAISSSQPENLERLTDKAKEALSDSGRWRLFRPPSPSTIGITFFDPAMADGAELLPEIKRTGDRDVEFSHDDYSVLFKLMLAAGVIGASRLDSYF